MPSITSLINARRKVHTPEGCQVNRRFVSMIKTVPDTPWAITSLQRVTLQGFIKSSTFSAPIQTPGLAVS